MDWALRYAPHLGYAPPDRPLFRALAGSDPVDHIRFAAREGMAGVMDPWCVDRPREQQRAMKAALTEAGLAFGCVVATPMPAIVRGLWSRVGAEMELMEHFRKALDVAGEMGSTTIAVLLLSDGETPIGEQRRRAVARLRNASDLAAKQNATLVLEPMKNFPNRPPMLVSGFADAVNLVREAAHPAFRLIYDTGHLVAMGEPVFETLVNYYDDIGLIQVADMPGRVEVGGGEIDFKAIFAEILRRGYSGLIELEHHWKEDGAEGERRGLEKLRTVDGLIRSRMVKG